MGTSAPSGPCRSAGEATAKAEVDCASDAGTKEQEPDSGKPAAGLVLTVGCDAGRPEDNNHTRECQMRAYCVKCRKKVVMAEPKAITMKNKRPATQGKCPACGTKVFLIGKG